jgi:hypothetical protein
MATQYKIVTNTDLAVLTVAVTQFLNSGWICQGGICVAVVPNNTISVPKPYDGSPPGCFDGVSYEPGSGYFVGRVLVQLNFWQAMIQ